MLAAVSAPSSLAAELASELGMTLVGFLRGDSMVVYSNPQRIGATRAAAVAASVDIDPTGDPV
jgi:FdhD protein